jgi:SAM-dependent methyltransferase
VKAPERVDLATRIPRTQLECEHYARYVWASEWVRGDVLDVACGTGYGARMLASHARVSGVDRDEEAIATALSRVTGTFLVAEVPPIPFSDNAFDFVVSFETVEHIPDDRAFVGEIERVLRPGGVLLMSTPNKNISAPHGAPLNHWHIREYTLDLLMALLGGAGLQVRDVYAQGFPPKLKRGHRFAWRLHGLTWSQPAPLRIATRALLGDTEVRPRDVHQPDPGYWLVSARKGKS